MSCEVGRAGATCRVPTGRGWRGWVAWGLVMVLGSGTLGAPVVLEPKAASGFARYVELTNARNEQELKGGAGLWIDALAGGEREAEYAALRRGDVELRKLHTLDGDRKSVV